MMSFTSLGPGGKLAVILGARGEQEVLGTSYCNGPRDGGMETEKRGQIWGKF